MTLVNQAGSLLVKLAIAVPSQDTVSAGFALDLARLSAAIAGANVPFTILSSKGTLLPQQRATLVKAAQSYGATHLLWLDADMRFPSDTFRRLIEHQQAIVAANYPTKRLPILPTAEHRELGMLFTAEESSGLAEVSYCGMGVMLVDMAVYATLSQPWFILGFNPKEQEYIGEDVFFCRRAKEHGYRVLIDHDLSKEVRHVGEMEFRAEHTMATRAAYNAAQEVAGVA